MRFFSKSFRLRSVAASCLLTLLAAGCTREQTPRAEAEPPQKLSEFGLFAGNGSTQKPVEGVIPYDLNSPLFTDYAEKFRFVKLPPGTSAKYSENDAFNFPVGTVIAKTFAYSADARKPNENRRLLATRLGADAVDRLTLGEHGVLVGFVKGETTATPLTEVVSNKKPLDLRLLELARMLAR